MIDRAQVLQIAQLARLDLSEEEVERYARELSEILTHVERIAAADVTDVAPTAHLALAEGTLRADEVQPSLARADALAGAPEASEEGFLVPSPQA
ncbi:MAG TPA: Asp-tRNA(Asn)/Glu-tRNA(Gln) amidotransferase subunit GatC [Solirubrobacteraceae bacterium]|nr:Asp-tRNA(Asn)/Glu-tRNA(Gln) amidotransferase subunit GatC [Solirubrobacteraceae bacterium]